MKQTAVTLYNPFRDDSNEIGDLELVTRASDNDREALEQLLTRHLPWIFNLSLRMLSDFAEAEEATQDILVRAFGALRGYRGEIRFSTWLYRIASTHLLSIKTSRWNASESFYPIARASNGLQIVQKPKHPTPFPTQAQIEMLVVETRIQCTIGSLMFLDGPQRLIFVLGAIFRVTDKVGAEIAEVTPGDFRQALMRARRTLCEHLCGKCSEVNPEAPCKCASKTRAHIRSSRIAVDKLIFAQTQLHQMRDVADGTADEVTESHIHVVTNIFRDHPFYETAEHTLILREVLEAILIANHSVDERLCPGW
jgi:RNA polymerase sigma factor (sigma-70 family)